MKPNPHTVPPGGWHFQHGTVVIRGSDFFTLVNNLSRWRIESGIPIGDPAREVSDQICSQHPHFCQLEPGDSPPVGDSSVHGTGTVLERVNRFQAALSARPPLNYVNASEASRRADICRKCPHNVMWKASCVVCLQAVDQQLYLARQGKDVSKPEELMGCMVAGHDNRTAVWLTVAELPTTPSQKRALPPACWKREL